MWMDIYSWLNVTQVKTWEGEKWKIEIPEETRLKKIKLIMEYHKDWEFDKFDEGIKKFISERLNFPNIPENIYETIFAQFKEWYCDYITTFLILCNIEWYTKKLPEIDTLKDDAKWWLDVELKEEKDDEKPIAPPYWWFKRDFFNI